MKVVDSDTDVHFGEISDAPVDWRNQDDDDDDPDDEELPETPPDVIAVLGFDPLEPEESRMEEMRSVLAEAFRYYP